MGGSRKQIIFHCGSYKTGSSSLQERLYFDSQRLRENGVLYPETGIRFDRPELGHRHSEFAREPNPDLLLALRDEIRTSDCDTVVMSSEAWSDVRQHLSLWSLMGALRLDAEIEHVSVLYLRNVCDYAVRHYREFTLRWHNRLTFPQYVKANRHIFDYLMIAQRLNDIFAGHQTRYYCYEDVGDVVGHFTASQQLPDLSPLSSPSGRMNVGRDAIETEICRLLNAKLTVRQMKKINRDDIVQNHPFQDESKQYLEDFSSMRTPFSNEWGTELRAYCSLSAEQVETLAATPDFTQSPINKIRPALASYVEEALAKTMT